MSAIDTPATSVSPSPSIKEQGSSVFGATVDKKLPEVIHGEGIKFTIRDPYTGEVSEIIDGMTGAAVGALGWGDKDAPKFVDNAVKSCTYSFTASIGNQYAEALSDYYIKRSPPGAFASALWTTSGSEANEMALKTIRQYWLERGKPQKIKNLSRYTSYHGYTISCLALGNSNRSTPFSDILGPKENFVKLPEYYPYRHKKDGESDDEYSERLLQQYEEIILKEDPETIASLTVETVSGTSLGTPCPTKTYLYGLRKLCTKYDIIFHLDEVMCGTGRINGGGLNAWENFLPLDQGPDLQTVGKTLGSGYVTIAGLLVSPQVKDVFVNGTNKIIGGQTYACHGFTCYVALQVQEKIEALNLTKNMFEMGNFLGNSLREQLADSKIAGDVRGLGGFWTVELVKDRATKEPFDPSFGISTKVKEAALKRGLYIMAGTDCIRDVGGDFIMFAPSFVVTKENVEEVIKLTIESIKEVEATI